LTGCGSQSLTTTLELIISTTSAAVDIAFPQYGALLNPYFTAVNKFIDQTTAELATAASAAEKAVAISGYAAAIIAPNLSGVAELVVTRVEAIGPLIAQLIDDIKSMNAAIQSTPGGELAFFAVKKVKPPSKKELEKVRAKNAALKAKLKQ